MTSKITAAVDALITAAFIEGGVSPEKVQQAHELTDQRKSELMAAIGAPCLHQIAEPALDRREAFEAWVRSYGTWEVQRDDDTALGTTSYTDLTLTVVWHAVQSAAAPQAVQAAVPVGGQSRFKGEKDWQWCSPEHVAMVLATPSDWQGYEVRYLYAAPAHPAEGVPAAALTEQDAILLNQGIELLFAISNDERNSGNCSAAEGAEASAYAVQRLASTLLTTHPSQQGLDAREFPAMTPELASILGLMCFLCISLAQALRAAGHSIKTSAEDEQAAVLHWMLSHYFRHGEKWRDAAAEDMERMKADALAAQTKQGGAQP